MEVGPAQGRKEIFAVHARGKEMEDDITYERIARATAGFTGADIMNLMNQAAIITVRSVRVCCHPPRPASPPPPHLLISSHHARPLALCS